MCVVLDRLPTHGREQYADAKRTCHQRLCAHARARARFPRDRWFEPANDGWYRMKTMFRGEENCLEGNQAASPVHSGAAFMDRCQDVSGQLWKFEAQK